jgi:hypothetical protein
MNRTTVASSSASAVVGLSFVAGLVITSASASSAAVVHTQRSVAPSLRPCIISSAAYATSVLPALPQLDATSVSAASSADAASTSTPRVGAASRITKQLTREVERLTAKNRAHAVRISDAVSFLVNFLPLPTQSISDIDCSWCDDGSLLAELMLPNRRVGFSFEGDESKSSWFIASLPPSRFDGSGYLRDVNPVAVLLRGLLSR